MIVGEEVHPTVLKALGLLGLGRDRIVRVPVDGQGRMLASALPAISGPTIVVAQAGNLNTGAFDPLPAIIAHAHAGGAWVHVDGAFGLWAGAVPALAHHVAGVEQADSVGDGCAQVAQRAVRQRDRAGQAMARRCGRRWR
ncbi:MAG: aminotransferase class V-fold PLP-dependent enzyme [Gemmatimonadales bacterium]